MARRKKQHPLHEGLRVEGTSAEGKAVARHEGKVVFIKGAVPGDVVDVQVNKKKKSFEEGYVTRLVSPSEDRVEPVCEHFGTCGGCKWQFLDYSKQIEYKQTQVKESFERIGHLEVPTINPIIGSDPIFFYRNKMEYTFSNKRWFTESEIEREDELNANGLGFHIPGRFDRILDIEKCWLQDDFHNQIRNFVKQYAHDNELSFFDLREQTGLLRNLVMRNSNQGQWMVILVFFHQSDAILPLLDAVYEAFPSLHSLMYVVNEKKNDTLFDQDIIPYKGADHIVEKMEDISFKIGPKSFFQTNSKQALELYQLTRKMAKLTGEEVVYDLYTGTGTIANFVAHQAKSVVGIEFVEAAIEDAWVNSANNNIENIQFYAGDMKDVFTPELIEKHGKPDVIITDPPRAGMHKDVIEVLLGSGAQRIVYVSCNPSTQARDVELLAEKYDLMELQPVDMFPHTHHVENIVTLELKS